jgi:hypothetical protein
MNRHLKIAFFIAPVLALVAYALTGYLTPKQKVSAGDYQLQQSGECRPVNSSCLLSYADFELKLISKQKQDKLQLAIVSNQELDALSFAMSEDNISFKQFKIMKADNKKYWQVFLEKDQLLNNYKYIRLASQSEKSNFYIETGIRF